MSNQSKFDQIHGWVKSVWDNVCGDQQANYAKFLGTKLQPYVRAAVESSAQFIADTILDTPVQRGGLAKGMGKGKTTLRAEIAYFTDNTIQGLNAANANANPEEVLEAVRKGLEEQTLQAPPTASGFESVEEVK